MPWLALPALFVSQDLFAQAVDADRPPAAWQFSGGASVISVPQALGSDRRRLLPLPSFEARRADGLFVSLDKGLGIEIAWTGQVKLSGGLAVDLDARRVRDDKRFAGLHDIHEAPAARLAIDVDLGSWALSATLQSRLAAPRQGGTTLVADLTWTLVAGNAGQLGLGLTGRLMDSWHARNFLSVDAGQSAASGLPGYRADAGLLEAGPLLQGLLRLNDDWALFGRASFGRLGSQGAGSPLVRSKANTVLIFSASRPF